MIPKIHYNGCRLSTVFSHNLQSPPFFSLHPISPHEKNITEKLQPHRFQSDRQPAGFVFPFVFLLISKIIHLQILLGIIQIFFNNFQSRAILMHFFQSLAHLLTDSPAIIFCKKQLRFPQPSEVLPGCGSLYHNPSYTGQ